jgi:lipoprotein NlpD
MKLKILCLLAILCSVSCSFNRQAPVEDVQNTTPTQEATPYNEVTYTKLYEVKTTDTLISVARKNNTTPRTLVQLNNLQKPYTITPGQLLKVPTLKIEINGQDQQRVVHITPKK